MLPEDRQREKKKEIKIKEYKGDWSNGMTGVSKTLSGSSILSSPVMEKPWEPRRTWVSGAFVFVNEKR